MLRLPGVTRRRDAVRQNEGDDHYDATAHPSCVVRPSSDQRRGRLCPALRSPSLATSPFGRSVASMPHKPSDTTRPLSLTKFVDRLILPPALRPRPSRPGAYGTLRVHMRPARVRLHSELPLTDVWAYESRIPGPTIEVRRGQRVQIEWVNAIPADAPHPVMGVTAPDPDDGASP